MGTIIFFLFLWDPQPQNCVRQFLFRFLFGFFHELRSKYVLIASSISLSQAPLTLCNRVTSSASAQPELRVHPGCTRPSIGRIATRR